MKPTQASASTPETPAAQRINAHTRVRNVFELLTLVYELCPDGEEVAVHLHTKPDSEQLELQVQLLNELAESFSNGSPVLFSWEFDDSPSFHERSIVTDHGWKIGLGRGLEMFQYYQAGKLSLQQSVQEARLMKGCDIYYVRLA